MRWPLLMFDNGSLFTYDWWTVKNAFKFCYGGFTSEAMGSKWICLKCDVDSMF